MEKIRKNKGITLIALVITIVILLILAGIAIAALTGDNGLFSRAQQAKEETIKSQLKEEITMAIQEIQAEELPKGNNVTLETLADGQLEEKLEDITVELEDDKINGEYKNYEYTINSNLEVTIKEKASENKIKGKAEIQSGYVFEGNTIEITVTASTEEGTITGIEAPEGATIKADTSTTKKVYTVSKNGKYIFKITGNNGKTRDVTAKVENILSIPQIKISEIKEDSFKINVENDYPNGAITEYKYFVGGTVKQQGKTDKTYTVTGLTAETEYSNIKVAAYIDTNTSKESNVEKVTTEMKDAIPYSWDEIAEIAKAISDNNTITDDSETATVTIKGEQKTLKVGQMKKLDGKKVRILGFNHDELSEASTAYGSSTLTGKAGISFEYVDFLVTNVGVNTSSKNTGGWAASNARKILNDTNYNAITIKNYIKKVNKEYIPVYNKIPENMPVTQDYLWLLSCGEIWDNGNNGGVSRGYAIVTEGKQYKYYEMNIKSTNYNTKTDILKKPNISKSNFWWLRSPYFSLDSYFCQVTSSGSAGGLRANYNYNGIGLAPGFAI